MALNKEAMLIDESNMKSRELVNAVECQGLDLQSQDESQMTTPNYKN